MVYKDVWKVINLNEKQDIILKFLREGLSQREISRRTGIARDTIRKYVRYYEDKLKKLGYELNEIDKVNLIEDIVEPPKYNSSPRTRTAVTDEVIEKLESFLQENENKRLTGFSKQQMKKIDMYEALIEEGFNVSYSSIVSAVNKLDKKKKEAFIRQEYLPGNVVEFDFGTVKFGLMSIFWTQKVKLFYAALLANNSH